MNHLKSARSCGLGIAAACLALMVPGPAHAQGQVATFGQDLVDQLREWTGWEEDGSSSLSVKQIACMIDCLDKKLFKYGKIAVKSPDVFGQNRMTGYRADYEDQMKSQLGAFELILSSYQRRSDSAALTSATSVAAGLRAPQVAGSRRVSATTTNVAAPPPALPLSGLFTNASQLVGSASPDLTPTTVAAAALTLANSGSKPGIGLEPTVALDERSNYLYHLNQLRRINAGDDSAEVAGYGLYLIRMPVSLLPSGDSLMGKGASVTVRARHNITPDLLPNTFRNALIFDTAYSLADNLNRGLFRESFLDDQLLPDGRAKPRTPPNDGADRRSNQITARIASVPSPGNHAGASGNAPSTEVLQLFGSENLKVLVDAMKLDQVAWYRHDPSTISWLLSELNSAFGYMRDQAHRNNPMFQPIVFEQVAQMVLQRRYKALEDYRAEWIKRLRVARGVYQGDGLDRPEPIDILSFALIVQSVYLDRQIKYDMESLSGRKGCACGDPWGLSFYDLYPTTPEDIQRYEQAKAAFAAYVECKWPIHIFAIDPVVDQQNQLDLFSQRTQLQLALAIALSSGQVNFQNATSYARRTELDLETVALNRTAIGFGAGDATFGWQFYPRIQTPPLQSNPRRIAGILINNGPGPDYAAEHSKIEPGLRECYALVVMPNFVPSIRFTSVANWFDLKTKCPEQVIETTAMVRLSKKFQAARNSLALACDPGRYRPDEVEMLADRLSQLEDMLPLKSHKVDLPFEASLLGSEIFSSSPAGLAPRLFAWYGEPPREGEASSIFLFGSGFTVYETHVIAGGVAVPEDATNGKKLELISRNVMRIEIPATARTKRVRMADEDSVHRTLIDVHVATPNGISNHLLVEVDPKEPKAAPPPPAAPAVTRALNLSYLLLRQSDPGPNPNTPSFIPILTGVAPENAAIDLTWPAAGPPPATVDATITFPNPNGGGADLSIPVKGMANQPGGPIFPLKGDRLATFAADLIEQLGKFDLLNPQNPAPQLMSIKITLTPPRGAGNDQDATASGPLVINFTHVPTVAHVTPAALSIKLGKPLVKDAAKPSDIAIDWLGGVAKVQANITFDLIATTGDASTPLGSINFTDGQGGDIQFKGGMRVIPEAAFLVKLNGLMAQFPEANKLKPGSTVSARTIIIMPKLDGIPLAPILITSPFKIDLVQQAAERDRAPVAQAYGPPGFGPMPAAGLLEPPRADPTVIRASGAGSRKVRSSAMPDDLPPLPGPRATPAPAVPGQAARTPERSRRPSLLQRLRGHREPVSPSP